MKKWYRLGLFNLFILAFLGLLLRYKAIYPLPFFDYTNLLHAHSHFAFNGWMTFLLQLVILEEFTDCYQTKKTYWNGFFLMATIVNYAMIASSARTGYGPVSTALSTAGLFLSYIYCYRIYHQFRDTHDKNTSTAFAKAALFFLLLSSLGPYALGILMATKAGGNMQQNALYFFLYFQYAGWFSFAILAFLFKKLEGIPGFRKTIASAFYNLLLFSCIPAFLFVFVFDERPVVITVALVATAIAQSAALFLFVKILLFHRKDLVGNTDWLVKGLYTIAVTSFALEFILQFISIHPVLAQILRIDRPVMIAYLHLVFLCFASIYMIAILIEKQIILTNTKAGRMGTLGFVAGAILNEALLAAQAACSLFGVYPHPLPTLLFANTILLAAGALLVFIGSLSPIRFINYSLQLKH